MPEVTKGLSAEKSSSDIWSEWKRLLSHDFPAAIRGCGPLVSTLTIIIVAAAVMRATIWPFIQSTKSLVEALRFAGWPQVTVIVSLVVGFVAVFVGISVCIYRYIDTR